MAKRFTLGALVGLAANLSKREEKHGSNPVAMPVFEGAKVGVKKWLQFCDPA